MTKSWGRSLPGRVPPGLKQAAAPDSRHGLRR